MSAEILSAVRHRPNEEIHTYPTRQGGHIPANITGRNMTQKMFTEWYI